MDAHSAPTVLAEREEFRESYTRRRDPIADERISWRAHSLRNLVHLLPGSTVLELGCGSGRFTRELERLTRGECALTAVSFRPGAARPDGLGERAEFLALAELPGALRGRRFDVVFAQDLLDARVAPWLFERCAELLAPGGHLVAYESNPRNPVRSLRRLLGLFGGLRDRRRLLARSELVRLASRAGLRDAEGQPTDFVWAPLGGGVLWLLRNLSLVLENAPGVRELAGATLLHARSGEPAPAARRVSLCRHAQFRGRLSVVIPCRNEEHNVVAVVDALRRHYDEYLRQIVIVDDGSIDRTRALAQELAQSDARVECVPRTPPHGVGRALTDGLRAARGEWVLTMDCDFQHLLPDLAELFDAAARGADVAVGSRFSRHSVLVRYPFGKILANRGFHVLAKLLLRRDVRDLTNNLKLMRRAAAQELVLREPHFAANAETGFLPLLAGWRVDEVPISWIGRTAAMGSSSFRLLRVGAGYARVLWHLALRERLGRGRYRDLAVHGYQRGTRREPSSGSEGSP